MKHTKQLLHIMARLRDPKGGCPWDVEQDFVSIVPYTQEEAYEVADAAERGDMRALKEELGDLLLQVVFHAQIAREAGLFDFEEVAAAINEKLIARHPHVFGEAKIASAEAQTENWEKLKAQEKNAKGHASLLDDIPLGLPALTRAQKLTKKAARAGFDWPEIVPVFAKIEEELAELREALAQGDRQAIDEETGDVIFACVNLARHAKTDAETALRAASRKFEQRFRYIEQQLSRQGRTFADSDLAEMGVLWEEAKRSA